MLTIFPPGPRPVSRTPWLVLAFCATALWATSPVHAADKGSDEAPARERTYREQDWGIALGLRYAAIPFEAEDRSVADIVPLLFFENKRFYLHGMEGGLKVFQLGEWQFNAVARYRFFDIPPEFQNAIQGGTFDFGVQTRRPLSERTELRLEALTDPGGRTHGVVRGWAHYGNDYWRFNPYAGARLKSSPFNNRYYGLNVDSIGAGFDLEAGFEGRYHLWSNLFVIGLLQGRWLDGTTRSSDAVRDAVEWESYLGVGLFNDPGKKPKRKLRQKGYLRVAHGWATPSDLAKIIRFQSKKDPDNHQMTSLFYGYPVADELLTLPVEVYLTPGVVVHHPSEFQPRILEYALGMKLYYTFRWPLRWRFGAAEGLSYATEVPHVERASLEKSDYRPSKLLNYLDFSLDLSLGDLFRVRSLKPLWLGYSIHHRSGIFSTGSQFGRISGGSNFNSVYLQWHF